MIEQYLMNTLLADKQPSSKILILGLGNEILTDDAIGPKIVFHLQDNLKYQKLKFDTAACGGLELVEMISGYNQVVIIDAIKTLKGIPGNMYKFSPEDFQETLHISSFHDVSFLTGLQLAKTLNITIPSEITILAIEIIEDLVFSDQLSPELQSLFPQILKNIESEIIKLVL